MNIRRGAVAMAAAFLLLPLSVGGASAAPPDNDSLAGATVVAAGQTITEDTSEATSEESDVQADGPCGSPALDATVWFTYTDTTGAGLAVDTRGSDYPTGIIVYAGTPESGRFVACAPRTVSTGRSAPGTVYTIMIFNAVGGPGGSLKATFGPPPTVSVTVDPRGSVGRAGSATISGTLTCGNADGENADVSVDLVQQHAKGRVEGDGAARSLPCNGRPQPWSMTILPAKGAFVPGKVSARVTAACTPIACAPSTVTATVHLTRVRAKK